MARPGTFLLILAITISKLGAIPAQAAKNETTGDQSSLNTQVIPKGGIKPKPENPTDGGDIIPMPFPGMEPFPGGPRDEVAELPPLPNPIPGDRQRSRERAEAGEDQINQDPQPLPGRTGRVAREYLRGGDPASAERVLDRLIGASGADAEAYRLRSAARFQQEKWAGAYNDAQTALDSNPNDKVAADLAGTSKMQLQRLGLKPPQTKPAEPRRELPQTPQTVEKSAPGAPDSRIVPLLGGKETASDPRQNFFAMIDRKIAIGGKQEAFLGLTQYLDRNPDDAMALWKRAYVLNRGNNPKAALVDAEKALALTPDDPATLREKAYALIQLGKIQDALGFLERAIRLQPNNGLGYLYRAMAHKALGERDAALADYARATDLDSALQSYYDAALAELGGFRKKNGGITANWRLRGAIAVVALPLLLIGLWSGAKHYSGRTTRGNEGSVGPVVGTPPPSETLVDGNVLGGLYRVGRVLGRGGMGVVFEAWDLGLERKVAIKQLRTPAGAREDYERFLKEARLVARLQHPNIVQIHTLVEDNSLLYLVFELVEGRGLDAVLAEKGRFSPQEARVAVRDICAALDCAHEARIIHRDLKPSNVMLTAKGTFKVMDFGIAHQAQSEQMLTQTGAWGTPPYMAPEQERGLVSKESDLFALGCTVYELLTGGRPFGPGADKTTQTFKPLSSLVQGFSPPIDYFMTRALAPDPADRFHSGREFYAAFESCLTGRIAA